MIALDALDPHRRDDPFALVIKRDNAVHIGGDVAVIAVGIDGVY